MTKIAHIFPMSRNIGDYYVQHGIFRLLNEHFGDLEYTRISAQKYTDRTPEPVGLTRASLDLINQQDLLVIGGSNLYEISGDRWGVDVEPEALDGLRVPVLLIGIGSGWSFKYPTYPQLSGASLAQIGRLYQRAGGGSVRDHLTARILQKSGVGPSTVTGCPAAFLADQPMQPARGGVVGVSALPWRMYARRSLDPREWRKAPYQRKRLITEIFLNTVKSLRERGYTVKIVPHDERDVPITRELFGDDFFYSSDVDAMLAHSTDCDVIVGFRLHHCISALGYGVPSIPLLLDGRAAGFCETFGVTELAVPAMDPVSTVPMLMERVQLALGPGREHWQPVFERRDQLHQVMRDFVQATLSEKVGAAPAQIQ